MFSCSSPDLREGIYERIDMDDFGTCTIESYNITNKGLYYNQRVQLSNFEARNVTKPNVGINIIIDDIIFSQFN